jgi:hypothetical protein
MLDNELVQVGAERVVSFDSQLKKQWVSHG